MEKLSQPILLHFPFGMGTKWYNHHTNKKLALNSRVQAYQILKNKDQMFILRLSYFITILHRECFSMDAAGA
jgi:hypothetical protein